MIRHIEKRRFVRLFSLSKKSKGLLRVATLNPYIPAAAVHPPRRIALLGGFSARFAAREPKG